MRPGFSSLSLLLIGCGLVSGRVSVQDPSWTFFSSGSLQRAPATTNPVPRHSVTGTVVNSVTGEPIRRALVRVNAAEAHAAFSGPDGRFELMDVPEGQVGFSAQKPGFLDPRTIRPSSASGLVAVGPATKKVVLQLIPEAKIRGRVLDESGEPIESLSVALLAREIVQGRKQWIPRGQASTDATGEYSFEALAPGFYSLHTVPFPIPPSSSKAVPNGTTRSEVLPKKYYPDGPDLDSVQPMELKPGEESAVDFTLSPVPSFTVSGTAAGFSNQAFAFCMDEYGQMIASNERMNSQTGKFTIKNVPPGSWVVHVQSFGPQEQFFGAEQPVEVSAADITGLNLQPQSPASIPVHVLNGNESHNQLQLELTPARAGTRGTMQPFQKPGDPPGSLEFHNVPSGTYKLLARNLGNDTACIESARSGGTDLSRDDLMVTAGVQPGPLEITLRSDCADLSGTVRSSSETHQATGFVILTGESSLLAPNPIPVAPDGKFSFKGLTPGAYRVYAFSDISDLEFANPHVLRDLPSQEVNLAPNQKADVQVDLITRGK